MFMFGECPLDCALLCFVHVRSVAAVAAAMRNCSIKRIIYGEHARTEVQNWRGGRVCVLWRTYCSPHRKRRRTSDMTHNVCGGFRDPVRDSHSAGIVSSREYWTTLIDMEIRRANHHSNLFNI